MVYSPYVSLTTPATASTTTIPFTTGTTIVTIGFDWSCFVYADNFVDEEDAVYQLRDRKLRYGPFHRRKHPLMKSIYRNRKPVPLRQTILQPFRITRQ